ncbi:MAG: hypothetical protein GY768_10315 [Planctomycetaceae bacterium]|nr:hypothetical protein [Planctomycetaceae bacterium]
MQIVARWCCTSAVLLTILSTAHQASGTDSTFEAPIGMSATIEELILPGSELEVKPLANDPLVVLRITKVFQHGSSFRYHFTYYGLEPGSYDLANYLQRKDGSTVNDLPPIQVKVSGILPPGQVTPNPLKTAKSPAMGGYGLLLTLGAIVWVIGLFLLLRPDRRRNATDLQTSRPAAMTLADRLQPLVTSAANGSLTDSQRAELERLLLAYWRKKLGVHHLSPGAAMAALKADPEAGKLMQQLEIWLHHPDPDTDIDLGALLAPYRSIKDPDDSESPLASSPKTS